MDQIKIMRQRRAERLSSFGLPETGCLIMAGRQDPGATRVKTGFMDLVPVLQQFGFSAFDSVPNQSGVVVARGHNPLVTGAECGGQNAPAVGQTRANRFAGGCFPNLRPKFSHLLVGVASNQQLSILTEACGDNDPVRLNVM